MNNVCENFQKNVPLSLLKKYGTKDAVSSLHDILLYCSLSSYISKLKAKGSKKCFLYQRQDLRTVAPFTERV